MLRAFDGGRLFGSAVGPAPFLVLALPGWMHTVSDYDGVFARLPEGTGAVAIDLPGFGGATPEPDHAMGSAGYAEVVAPVLDELTAEHPVVLVGHSFGGRVAVHLAARHPDRVKALVLTGVPNLVATNQPKTKPPLGFRLAKALNKAGIVSDASMEARRRRSGSADYRNAPSATMRGVLVAAINESYEAELRQCTCPVELVWGENDTAAPIETAERAAAALVNGKLTRLAGVGHLTPTEAPHAIAEAIARHL